MNQIDRVFCWIDQSTVIAVSFYFGGRISSVADFVVDGDSCGDSFAVVQKQLQLLLKLNVGGIAFQLGQQAAEMDDWIARSA